MKRGFIFDMDGTLVDNMMVHHRAWQLKFAELGLEWTIDEIKEKVHGKNEEILSRLYGDKFTPEERFLISRDKEALYREIIRKELTLIDGLWSFLESAQAQGIPLSIGTAASPDNVHFLVDTLKIRPFFSAIVDSFQVSKGKPDPEVFQKAADGMGVDLEHCIVFEDSPVGAETARRAGCPVVIVTTTHEEREFFRFPNVIGFIKHYRGLSVESVLKHALEFI